MSKPVVADLFVEDRAQEALLRPLVERIGREVNKVIEVHVRAARGGHGRGLSELELYQETVREGALAMPDLVVVAIDGNCNSFNKARSLIREKLKGAFSDRTVHACPDPHIERWYLADLMAFHQVVGITPKVRQQKCERDVYKTLLAKSVAAAGHSPTLGGIEFAEELAQAMSFYRAGKADNSLKHFLDDTARQVQSA